MFSWSLAAWTAVYGYLPSSKRLSARVAIQDSTMDIAGSNKKRYTRELQDSSKD